MPLENIAHPERATWRKRKILYEFSHLCSQSCTTLWSAYRCLTLSESSPSWSTSPAPSCPKSDQSTQSRFRVPSLGTPESSVLWVKWEIIWITGMPASWPFLSNWGIPARPAFETWSLPLSAPCRKTALPGKWVHRCQAKSQTSTGTSCPSQTPPPARPRQHVNGYNLLQKIPYTTDNFYLLSHVRTGSSMGKGWLSVYVKRLVSSCPFSTLRWMKHLPCITC